ncbi:hypothetical protein GE300_22565 [Rhodobacteraceae bacterium 2CG4]|uniref:PepSY domain-containing protein n=1 Tax=Halovulum marinum TaxID=2662447 RepID=A0A6L5Z6Y5_9RHOB|nr:hypothetical protein [Halovulum marinum]MSU92316.1 hypothetical protein [Halovulum marinum]
MLRPSARTKAHLAALSLLPLFAAVLPARADDLATGLAMGAVLETLTEQGFRDIRVEWSPREVTVLASGGGVSRTMIYDAATGELLRDDLEGTEDRRGFRDRRLSGVRKDAH